jgi:AraC-like DNA-binding protein
MTFSAKRSKEMFKLRYSPNTLHRIFKEEGLVKPRKRKYKVKRDLREAKRRWKVFEQIDKDLQIYLIIGYI